MDIFSTQKFNSEKIIVNHTEDILKTVVNAMYDKGYNPTNQIVGYILSGDPTYITSHKNARSIITKIERDELLEVLVNHYLKDMEEDK